MNNAKKQNTEREAIGPSSKLGRLIIESRIKIHGLGALEQKQRSIAELQTLLVRCDELIRDLGAEEIRPLLARLHEQLGAHLTEEMNALYEQLAESLVQDETVAIQGML